ncbi:MAG: YajQ family cyclic di-GMP-binding protein [Myxococcales bacterium]|nr:YajQ family cyclic di-GMP-binding protein [Myxococcales bacterium]
MPSFDAVSKVQWNEIDNALGQVQKELAQRFDFQGTSAAIEKNKDGLLVTASTEDRVRAALKVLEDKLVKRKVSLRSIEIGDPEPGPKGSSKVLVKVKEGIETEKAKELVRALKDSKLKVQAAIQEQQVRVTGKNRDDLQEAIRLLRGSDFGIDLQFINFRE